MHNPYDTHMNIRGKFYAQRNGNDIECTLHKTKDMHDDTGYFFYECYEPNKKCTHIGDEFEEWIFKYSDLKYSA